MQETTIPFPDGILDVIRWSRTLRSHQDLFDWLQQDIQPYVPHDIFIAAWGDFYMGKIAVDVVSALPGIRTTEVSHEQLFPVLPEIFDYWSENAYEPLATQVNNESFRFPSLTAGSDAFAHMRSAVLHGIRDERGWDDCLYIALSSGAQVHPMAAESIGLLLPYIDTAFRQIDHLPMQRLGARPSDIESRDGIGDRTSSQATEPGATLTKREQEIMRWVSIGKTNPEIAQILDISPSTVRNHLYGIFRKLEVMNRAQAVFHLEQVGSSQASRST